MADVFLFVVKLPVEEKSKQSDAINSQHPGDAGQQESVVVEAKLSDNEPENMVNSAEGEQSLENTQVDTEGKIVEQLTNTDVAVGDSPRETEMESNESAVDDVTSEKSTEIVNDENAREPELSGDQATDQNSTKGEVETTENQELGEKQELEDKELPKEDDNVAKDDKDAKDEHEVVPFLKKKSWLQKVMKKLESLGVENITQQKTHNGKHHQLLFEVNGGITYCEEVLNELAELGVGDRENTTVGMYPASIYRGCSPQIEESERKESVKRESESLESVSKLKTFKKSIKARMLVTEVVNSVQGNANFTFDYLLLIILASVISAMGLVENSSVVLVASMLVSPIMGPILAGVFGIVIKNHHLRNLGIKSEIKGLLLCVIMGFLFGILTGAVNSDGAVWGASEDWPTSEMKSRGQLRSLWTGILIALPSGAGVALSVLGGNVGSLVGVAISASLLPPAVNAGMLWAYSFIAAIHPPPVVPVLVSNTVIAVNISQTTNSSLSDSQMKNESWRCPSLVDNTYAPVYSCDMAKEAAILGLISLTLTFLNIICIFIMGIGVLKIKEVAPQTAVASDDKAFWIEDVQIAKNYYATARGAEGASLREQARNLLTEWRAKNGEEPIQTLQLKRLMQEVEDDPAVKNMQRNIPGQMGGKIFSDQLADEFNRAEDDVNQDVYLPSSPVTYKTFHGFRNASRSVRNRFYSPVTGNTTPSMTFVDESKEDKNNAQPLTAGDNGTPNRSRFRIHNPLVRLKHPSKNQLASKRKEKKSGGKKTRFEVEKVEDSKKKPRFEVEKVEDSKKKPRFEVEKVEDSKKKPRFEVEKVEDQTQDSAITQSVISSSEASEPLIQDTTEL